MIKDVAKLVVGSTASLGVGFVLDCALAKIKPENLTKIGKVGFKVGSIVIGGIVGSVTTKYVETAMEDAIKVVKSIKKDDSNE